MCGILGLYNFEFPIAPLLLKQHHRGPDAAEHCTLTMPNGNVLQLGHNRLKIICLSDTANQPMCDESEQHFLVFNGEIYNYLDIQKELKSLGIVFRTTSDSEVLLLALKQWGMAALEKFNGMFAFAYFNNHSKILYLVRDRFGVKPLYYFYDGQRLMFASTSKVIADSLTLQPDYRYLKKGLQYGIFEDDSELTAYQDLKSILPGSYLQFSLSSSSSLQMKSYSYYQLQAQVDVANELIRDWNYKQVQESVIELLTDANRQRLRADVPMAVALSGGLDSSTIAVLAKQEYSTIQAFCFGDPNDKYSEGLLAKKLANKHQIQTQFVSPTDEEWKDAFWQTLAHQDAPYAGISVVAQHLLYKKIKEYDFKVVLGGQGGDEAFLGYRKFQLFYLKDLVAKKQWLQATQYFGGFSQMLWAERSRLLQFWRLRSKYATQQHSSSGLQLPGEKVDLSLGFAGNMQTRQIADVLQFSLPTLLRYEDRNSMAQSIESRLPFMDYRLIELACAIPVNMKLKKGYGKWIIRESMADLVPNEIRLARYKRGFDVVQGESVFNLLSGSIHKKLNEKKDYFQQFLPGKDLYGYFNPVQLNQSPQRFTELMTLLWLGERA